MRGNAAIKIDFFADQFAIKLKAPAFNKKGSSNKRLFGKPKVLLVEDDPVTRCYVQYMLQELGCEVLIATCALDAIKLYQSNIHLALVDINLPDLPGFNVANYIRTQEDNCNRHIPIIGHTSFIDKEVEYYSRLSGMDKVIEKLNTLEAFQTLLQQWLPQSV